MLPRMLNELGHDLLGPAPPPADGSSPTGSAPAESGRGAPAPAPLVLGAGAAASPAELAGDEGGPLLFEGGATSRTSFCRHSCDRLASACAASRKSSGTPGPAMPWLLMRRLSLLPDLGLGLPPFSPPLSRIGERIGDESRDVSREDVGDESHDVAVEPEREVVGEL